MDKGATPRSAKSRNFRLYGALGLSLLLAGLLVWQLVGRAQMQRNLAAERAEIAAKHEQALAGQAEPLLRTIGTLLGLVISAPLAAEDFETIESQIKGLIREKQILVVAVADKDDKIRIATNHKLEGQKLAEAFPGLPQPSPSVAVTQLDTGLIAVVSVVQAGAPVGRAAIFYAQNK